MVVGDFLVKWNYQRNENGSVTTKCRIIDKKDGNIRAISSVTNHYNDSFIKDVGRKLSLQRAVWQLTPNQNNVGKFQYLDRDIRWKFWETYRTETKIPRWSATVQPSKRLLEKETKVTETV